MTGVLIIYLIVATIMGRIVWCEDDWTPLWLRVTQCALAALFWPFPVVVFVIWMIGDGIGGLVRMLRK